MFDFIMLPIESILKQTLSFLYTNLGNYGLAIIAITIIIKIILFPLTLKQDKSMREMKRIQPQLEKIREKFKGNPQEMNKATIELYQEHKVNPFGGCLPVLLQMPVLFGLFSVLRNPKIIPADAHFLIFTLTAKDPTYILPILNAIIAFLQQKVMSKGTVQNAQTQMMAYIFPVMMFVISFSMPSGLQIYWLASSIIGVVQQYLLIVMSKEKEIKEV